MEALLVIDVQKGLVQQGDFANEISRINGLIQQYDKEKKLIVFMKHTDEDPESTLYIDGDGVNLEDSLLREEDYIIEKNTPSSFFKTNLAEVLQRHNINHVTITGFNTEYCCLFTGIAAYDRGYQVTFNEGATATVNNEDTYEMAGLDIKDFVGTVLACSGVIQVKE